MTASEVVLTDEMLPEIYQALHLRLQQTDGYLIGGHTNEPTETDLCCEFHKALWERTHAQQVDLQARRDRIVAAIRAIDPHMGWQTKGGRRG